QDAQARPGVQLAPPGGEDMLERTTIVEAEHLAVILRLAQLDFFGGEDLVEGKKVQRLAVDDHAVEIEEHRAGPGGHRVRKTLTGGRRDGNGQSDGWRIEDGG